MPERRISYTIRLAARRRYEEWEAALQQQYVPQMPQAYQQALGHQALPAELGQQIMVRRRRIFSLGYEQRLREEMMRYPYLTEVRRRSEALLERHLTDVQKTQLKTCGWFEVVGRVRHLCRWRKHLFRIHAHGLVYEHTAKGRRHHCIMALEPEFPDADWMLTIKLLIEGNCRKFFQIARARSWQGGL